MTQNEYRAEHELTLEAFGALIGHSSVTVGRYETGHRIPSPEIMAKIHKATNGRVTPNDYHALSGPEVAAGT